MDNEFMTTQLEPTLLRPVAPQDKLYRLISSRPRIRICQPVLETQVGGPEVRHMVPTQRGAGRSELLAPTAHKDWYRKHWYSKHSYRKHGYRKRLYSKHSYRERWYRKHVLTTRQPTLPRLLPKLAPDDLDNNTYHHPCSCQQ